VFQPALHGLTHFCEAAVKNALSRKEERTNFLRTLWAAETPYIYWRMPWIGYEYCNPTGPHGGFLGFAEQVQKIQETARLFKNLFGRQSTSACAPGYRANADTHAAWFKSGIRVAQKGSESPQLPYFDASNLLNLYRTIDLEPSDRDLNPEEYVEIATRCFDRGMPAVISVHAINFQSTLKDFRSLTLARLDQLLTALENKYPELLYLHDEDLYNIVTTGQYSSAEGTIVVDRDLRDSTEDRGAGTYACL
jgi:hypothetical protein